MNLPFYEMGIFFAGVIASQLLGQIVSDLYPRLRSLVFKAGAKIYYYAPHRVYRRREEAKRQKQKSEEFFEAVAEATEEEQSEE